MADKLPEILESTITFEDGSQLTMRVTAPAESSEDLASTVFIFLEPMLAVLQADIIERLERIQKRSQLK